MIVTGYNSLLLLLRKLNDCIQFQDNEGDGVSKRSGGKLCNYATKSAIFTCYLAHKTQHYIFLDFNLESKFIRKKIKVHGKMLHNHVET